MFHGDISNKSGITIAFKCEDFLVKSKKSSILKTVPDILPFKYRRWEFDSKVLSVMSHIYRNTEYCVDIVVEEGNYTKRFKEFIDSAPFSRVILVRGIFDIYPRILVGDISYYVDSNLDNLKSVHSEFAVDLDSIVSLVRKRGV